MLIKLLFLFTVTILVTQGRVSSRIKSDAAKWTELHKQYMDRSPYAPFRGQMKTKCRIMTECCPNERDRFFDLMHRHKFEETCIGHRESSSSFKSYSSKCHSSIRQLDHIKKSMEYTQFLKAMSGMPKSNARFRTWRSQMAKVCSTDELQAYYCEPDNLTTFQSCQRKVLRMVFNEDNGRNYDSYVREWENDYHTYIRKLSKAFPQL
jgi:hypothetical protein